MKTNNIPNSMRSKYQNLFVRTKNLIISPKEEWEIIYAEKSDMNLILANYILPYIGAVSLSSFVTYIAARLGYPFEPALKHAIILFTSFLIGLYVTYFITLNIIPKFTMKTYGNDLKILAYKITAYSSIILYLVKITTALIPQIFFLQILGLYVFYVVWLGSNEVGKFESTDLRIVFTVIVSVLILFIPYFSFRIFTLVIPM